MTHGWESPKENILFHRRSQHDDRCRRTGNRAYRKQDIEKLRLIKRLLYDEGYTIKGARKRLRRGIEGESIEENQSAADVLFDMEGGLQKILDILDLDD